MHYKKCTLRKDNLNRFMYTNHCTFNFY